MATPLGDAQRDLHDLIGEYEALHDRFGRFITAESSAVLWPDGEKDQLIDAAPVIRAKLKHLEKWCKRLDAQAREGLDDSGHGFLALSQYKLELATIRAEISEDWVRLESAVWAAEDLDYRGK